MKNNLYKFLIVTVAFFITVDRANAQQKIGHVNSGEIIQAMSEYKTAEAELQKLNETKTNELQQMFAEFQKKQTDAQEKARTRSEANKDSIDAQLQTLSVELQEIERRLTEVQQLTQQEMGKKQEELLAPIFQKANTAVQSIAKEKGYAYVFDISNTNIPYFQGGDDLTEDVKTKLGITSTP